MDDYLKIALQEAIDEIAGLRRVNEIQSAQLDIVFIFRDAIRGARSGIMTGAGEDVAWKLRRILLDAEADEKRKREVVAVPEEIRSR